MAGSDTVRPSLSSSPGCIVDTGDIRWGLVEGGDVILRDALAARPPRQAQGVPSLSCRWQAPVR